MNKCVLLNKSCDKCENSIILALETTGYTFLQMFNGTGMGEPLIILKPPTRRDVSIAGAEIINGNLCLHLDDHAFYVDGKPVKLTATEMKIVELFMQEPDHILSSGEIYGRVWNATAFASDNIISVHIHHIRKKIEKSPKFPQYIKTVWGVGYFMEKFEK